MKLKFFSTLAIISLGVLFYNCETSQTIAFLHKESQNYFDKREIDTEKFKRNIVDGILFTVDIEPADDGNISVWLGINSKHKLPNIRLVNASIKNNEKSRRFGYHYLGMDLDNDYCTLRNDTYECDVSLFKSLAQNKLEEYTQKDDFLIKVELEMNAKIVKQSFHIKRKVKKYKITFS